MASENFVRNCAKRGYAATLTQITAGTDCPCRLTYDSDNPTYSAEWHEQNPSIEDCGGTLLIGRTETTVNVKFFITDLRLRESSQALSKEIQEAIGKLHKDDLAITGTVNVDEMIFVNLSDATEKDTYFTIDGKVYRIKFVYDIRTRQLDGQLILLRRTS